MTENNIVTGPGGREKIHEIVVRDVVVEIWLKRAPRVGKVYFDFILSQEYKSQDGTNLGEFIQFRYANNAMEAILKAQEWLRANKEKYYPKTGNALSDDA